MLEVYATCLTDVAYLSAEAAGFRPLSPEVENKPKSSSDETTLPMNNVRPHFSNPDDENDTDDNRVNGTESEKPKVFDSRNNLKSCRENGAFKETLSNKLYNGHSNNNKQPLGEIHNFDESDENVVSF